MPRGTKLSEVDIAIIKTLHKRGVSNRKIASEIDRSETVVRHYLSNPSNYGQKKRSGRKSSISKRQQNVIFKKATEEMMSCSQIKADMKLAVSRERIRQIIKKDNRAIYAKMLKKPLLTDRHIQARLSWARGVMDFGTKWRQVIFTDEKKFSCDGPDGFKMYWHDLSKDKKVCMSRNFKGKGIMIWGAFSYNGKCRLRFITDRMNSEKYTDMLENCIDEFEDIAGTDFIFQQDNAAIHVSKKSKEWFRSKDIELLSWPAISPDMNPIENLWGIIARDVYRNGRQFKDVASLKLQILQSWMNITNEMLRKLVDSMPSRVFELINNKGSHTSY
jgi:transposase